jgi:hypothetical protein
MSPKENHDAGLGRHTSTTQRNIEVSEEIMRRDFEVV